MSIGCQIPVRAGTSRFRSAYPARVGRSLTKRAQYR
jgi:hypothetical protein